MLKTNYDFSVLKEFFISQPDNFSEGDLYELERWVKYLKFLKSGTDLVLTNFQQDNISNLITTLTTGRGESNFILQEEFKEFYRNVIPKNHNINEIFFLNETNEVAQKKYRSKNPYHIGFISDHFEAFESLAMLKFKTTIPVRIDKSLNQFSSWQLLSNYALPFSDCIIIDNFLFSESEQIWEKNLREILIELDKSTSVKYNLLIITYRGNNREIKVSDINKYLMKIKEIEELKANISVIVTSKIEHDRNIFMNYQRIKSGTSFNYFNSHRDPMVNTEIEFLSYADPMKFDNAKVILKNINKKVLSLRDNPNELEIAGDLKNRLLTDE